MRFRTLLRVFHGLAACSAIILISWFLVSTLFADVFGPVAAVVAAKSFILKTLPLMVIALVTLGATGMILSGGAPKGLAAKKLRRMCIVAPNGLLVLIPCAIFLHNKAQAGAFDSSFVIVQCVEIAAGALNLFLLALSARDGLIMTRRIRPRTAPRAEKAVARHP